MHDSDPQTDFIREAIREDLRKGRFDHVHTRFPPEPNAYLHIGHAKAVWINYGIAQEFGGKFNLRFDDTNPLTEEKEYVDAIIEDVRWLGADWEDRLFFASDYFEQMYEWAEELIKKGKAYVCDLSAEEVSRQRGDFTHPGVNSPYRNRTVEENLDLFRRMRKGEFPDGAKTLRAKIDMSHPNMLMRDPVMYRILHVPHHRQGKKWCIYPTYDWAHGLEDSIEGITHSLCSQEYEIHRPLYDWFIDAINEGRTDDGSGPWGKKIHHPRQIEFARLNLAYNVMSKRKFLEMIRRGYIRSLDDPRLPTIAGMRRRGYTPEAIRRFCRRIGVDKTENMIDPQMLEYFVRDELNRHAERRMVVLRPLKVVIENYPEGVEYLKGVNNPEDPGTGTRDLPFSREIYIESDDFMEDPPEGFYRLAPGREVRLRYGYFIRCEEVVKEGGKVKELICSYDPQTRGGNAPDGRRVKSTLHWVSARHAIPVEVRLYDHPFTKPDPEDLPEGADFTAYFNHESVIILKDCMAEPSLKGVTPGMKFQFERIGYFCADPDSTIEKPVFNRVVTLKDTWTKIQKKMK